MTNAEQTAGSNQKIGRGLPGNRWDLLDDDVPDRLPTLSIVIAHYNQPSQLLRTLWALARQDYPGELVEIIVVDDGSTERPTVPEGILLLVQEDDGFRLAAARNLGAAAASNEILVFLDADTSPEPGYLRALTRLPSLSSDCVTVGRRRHADFTDVAPFDDVEVAGPQNELDEPRWLLDAYERSSNLLNADYRSYRFIIGAVLACSRDFFYAAGGFDESFAEYGGEDWEWAYRAWITGAVFAHVPQAVGWHDGPFREDRTGDRASKNAEAIRLADLVPVPGSRPRSLPTTHVDIAVSDSLDGATPGQVFVSRDSVLADLPGSALADAADDERLDRVRIEVHIERPVRVAPGGLSDALDVISGDDNAEVRVLATSGDLLLRLVSRRANARQDRWGGEPLLPTLDLVAEGVAPLDDEVDVEAYLGGWD